MKQLTKEQAIKLAESGEWKDWTDDEIVEFQLFQRLLCMPFSVFHPAMENVLGRGIYTHEFVDEKSLQDEYLGERPSPTFEEIVSMIPSEKLILLKL